MKDIQLEIEELEERIAPTAIGNPVPAGSNSAAGRKRREQQPGSERRDPAAALIGHSRRGWP